ncbi:hypothetical protein Q5P01_022776 [Channa striata]|uniref:Uncharacterized protein n=1 Tax=Channa striata TaxID=64152 RepID=A0AA88RW65_CHASR|nr:hypothetical protein Q5P01_022776 [Channa striata]
MKAVSSSQLFTGLRMIRPIATTTTCSLKPRAGALAARGENRERAFILKVPLDGRVLPRVLQSAARGQSPRAVELQHNDDEEMR